MKRNAILAQRLCLILTRLNQGERVDLAELADEFGVSIRTIQRDINERLNFLEWEEKGGRFYKINQQKSGFLTETDIQRFALFASVSDLFPQIDREFYQEKLTQSVQVKGFQYEDIRHLKNEFELIKKAIQTHQYLHFHYIKNGQTQGKFYKIAPHGLVNKNGIWYVIGIDQHKQKTFCFTQMDKLLIQAEYFEPNQTLIEEIQTNDSISHGNQLSEVLIKVSSFAAPYFLRRNLLPNQELIHKAENGELIISCKNINELDIVPLVQYWVPHLRIVSPKLLQSKLLEKLRRYFNNDE